MQKQKIDSILNNKKSWSSVIIKLAVLNARADAPFDELVEAIENIVSDLGEKQQEEEEKF